MSEELNSEERRLIDHLNALAEDDYFADWEWGYGGWDKFESEIKNVESLGGRPIFVSTYYEDGCDNYIVISSGFRIGRSWHDSTGYGCQGGEDVSDPYSSFTDLFLYGLTNEERCHVMEKFLYNR